MISRDIVPRGFCYGDIPLRIVFLFSIWLLSFGAIAAPGDVATLDRSTWPEKLDNPTLFDVASRAEILMFARVLLASEALDEPALAQRLGLRTINLESVNRVRQRLWQRLLTNYNFAQQSCDQDASFCFLVEDMATLREQAAKFQVSDDSYYTKWAEPSRLFHAQYLDEQLRKAALFPQTSSEVDRFGDYERNGDGMHDRLFLLTFDSAANATPDNTAWVAEYLRKSNISGTFFVLGKDIQARLAEQLGGQPASDVLEASASACRAGSSVPTATGRTGRTRCDAASSWSKASCRRTTCRCFVRPMASAAPMPKASSRLRVCR